jgi:hypothetical protein
MDAIIEALRTIAASSSPHASEARRALEAIDEGEERQKQRAMLAARMGLPTESRPTAERGFDSLTGRRTLVLGHSHFGRGR